MQDIGRTLKESRIARGLDIGEIARRTCISARYLRAMEEGQFGIIPNVFDRGYLKIYAGILQIDAISLLARYEEQKNRSSLTGTVSA